MTFWISALLFAAGLGAGLRNRSRRWRRASLARRRQVEQPNSFYSAPGVRLLVDLERWESIPLNGLHAVNRDEVSRLLRHVKANGLDALTAADRRFLDSMVTRR